MKLVVECNKNVSESFIRWLIKLIKIQILSNINNKRLYILNEYLNANNIFQCTYHINVRKIIIQMVNTLHYVKIGRYFVISFNQSIPLFNTRYKVIDVLKFITYGNTEIRGVPIVSNVFSGIANNIEKYNDLYLNGLII